MDLKSFIDQFAEQFEDTERSEFNANTEFRQLDEWSSLTGLLIIGMVLDVYSINLTADELRKCTTIEDVYNIVKNKTNV
ncbi:acyl carrier protein [Hoylesella marshii]|uniref:acyl carrier protein n=1 Tax=Hoylesella marshii TaxID=189722 RepID=UPI0028D65560|nr:acyl carrier protein [Hoylesella marshii]